MKSANRIRLNNQSRRRLFQGKSKRKSKFTGPDEHYGLTDLLQDDITTEELDVKKKQFIDKLMKADRGIYKFRIPN